MADRLVQVFLDGLATQNEGSAETVGFYLDDFEEFVTSQLGTTVSKVIIALKTGQIVIQRADDVPTSKEEQPYLVLARFARWLTQTKFANGENSARTVRLKVSWARNLMENNFIPISKSVFKQQVKMPKVEEPDLSPMDRKTACDIISKIPDVRMRSFVMFLGSRGFRSTLSLSLQIQHLEDFSLGTLKFTKEGTYINISGKHDKTKTGKRRPLTMEMKGQIETLLQHKYRPRTMNYYNKETGKWQKVKINPKPKLTDYVFFPYHHNEKPVSRKMLKNAYNELAHRFAKLMDRIDVGREEGGKRHRVTLHTFRRFCFTQCKKAVDEPFAKWYIGRKIHEYDKMTDEEKLEYFNQAAPHLTFLDTNSLAAQVNEMQAKERDIQKRIEAAVEKKIQEILARMDVNKLRAG